MQLKKLFAIGLAFTMMTTLLVGCSNKNDGADNTSKDVYTIGMITDTGGVNDESLTNLLGKVYKKQKRNMEVTK